jgi:hypothetical protein
MEYRGTERRGESGIFCDLCIARIKFPLSPILSSLVRRNDIAYLD